VIMLYTERVSPCRELISGADSDECLPADDIVVPLAGDIRRLQEIVAAALDNPDSELTAYAWIPVQITTTGFRRFREGEIFMVDYLGERVPGVIASAPQLSQQSSTEFTQNFTVYIIDPFSAE